MDADALLRHAQRLLAAAVDEAFMVLRDARIAADHDLNRSGPFSVAADDASLSVNLAQAVLDGWPEVRHDPNTRTFLSAPLFSRWTRRP